MAVPDPTSVSISSEPATWLIRWRIEASPKP